MVKPKDFYIILFLIEKSKVIHIPQIAKIVAKFDIVIEKVRTLQTAQLADLKSLECAYLREAFFVQ